MSDAQNGNYETLGDTRLTARRDVNDSTRLIGAERCDFVCVGRSVRVRRNKKLRKSDWTITTDGLRLLIVIVIGDFRRGCSCFRTKNVYTHYVMYTVQQQNRPSCIPSQHRESVYKADSADDLSYNMIFILCKNIMCSTAHLKSSYPPFWTFAAIVGQILKGHSRKHRLRNRVSFTVRGVGTVVF